MANNSAVKLNMGFMYLPTPFLAKISKPKRRRNRVNNSDAQAVSDIFGINQNAGAAPKKNDGAANFKPKNGKQRYSANQLKILTLIHKMRETFGDLGRLPHSLFERELELSHATVNHNLAYLRDDDGIITRENGVNDYYINPDITFSEKDYIIIYNFLLEKLNVGGDVKKLNYNAIILLCYIIRHYFKVKEKAAKDGRNNIKPEEAYFVGGKERVATLLNVAESTANDAAWELMKTAAIYRKAFYIDDKCQEVICDGKGNSSDRQTVYILNSKIIRMCEKVRAQIEKRKEKRTKKAAKDAQQAERREAKEYKQHANKARRRNDKAEQRKRTYEALQQWANEDAHSVLDDWAPSIEKMRSTAEPPEPFEEFTQHGNRPPTQNKDK